MSNLNSRKNQGITEYSVIVCLLLLKIWCVFANMALLFAVGGVISVAIDLGLSVYVILNAMRRKSTRNESVKTNNFIIVWLCFAVMYSLIFLLARNTLPQASFMGLFELPQQIYNTVFSAIYLVALALAIRNLNESERKMISSVLVVMFFAVALGNLIATMLNPDLIKNEAYTEDTSLFTLGYVSSYVLVLITPMILYRLGGKRHKTFFALFLVCNLVSVLYGGYFIAVLGTIVALAMYFIMGIKNKIVVLILAVLLAVLSVTLVFSGALEELMRYLADNVKIEVLQDRFEDIARYLSGNTDVSEGDTTFRIKIYQDTFESFLQHPLFGNYIFGNYACQRDHSTILDLLAAGGIFLFGLFIAVLVFGYKFACAFIKNARARRALLASIITYLFICLLNPVITYKLLGILFVVAPIIMGGEPSDENN